MKQSTQMDITDRSRSIRTG